MFVHVVKRRRGCTRKPVVMILAGFLAVLITSPRAVGQAGNQVFDADSSSNASKRVQSDSNWQGAIKWRTGNSATRAKSVAEVATVARQAKDRGQRHIVVQFEKSLEANARALLESAGLKLLDYLGDNAYFVSVTGLQVDETALAGMGLVMDAQPVQRAWKLHPVLERGEVPQWAALPSPVASGDEPDEQLLEVVDPENPEVAVYVVFHADVDLTTEATTIAMQHGATVQSTLSTINAMVAEMPFDEIASLADEDEVQWIEPALPSFTGTNDVVRIVTEAEEAQSAPYNLDGSDVTLMVFDTGAVAPSHPDFLGRLILGDLSPVREHATHVAGTACGDGSASSGLFRGMAPGATLVSFGLSGGSGTPFYADPFDIEQDYYTAIHQYGVELATNSIGSNVCSHPLVLPCELTGNYGISSRLIDGIVRGDLGRPIITTWANGNERGCTRCLGVPGGHTPEGYHSTAPPSCAKNHIAVGAVQSDLPETVADFSSFGPTDDGRIKPDVMAPGTDVMSCHPDGEYVAYSGTSMATPAVAGCLALFLEDFYTQRPTSPAPLNSTAKVLLAHTAADLGNPGPDYQSGYGRVRIREMIDFARQNFFFEDVIESGGIYTFLVRVDPGSGPLKLTLAWDDAPGTPNVDPALVNDLDLVVRDPLGQRYYPWTLNPTIPAAPAVQTAEDHTNNIEQVVVDTPASGLWVVEVYGYQILPGTAQPFSICASPRLARDCDEDGLPDDEEILGDPTLDCTGNGIIDSCEPDCNNNGFADSCDIDAGTSVDCDGNGIPDECQPDCNANGIADACDIDAGTSADCDRDLVPDECQDTSADCNTNGVWDPCDISAGTSLDENYNWIPDECEPQSTLYVDDDAPNDPGPGDPLVSDPAENGSAARPFDSIQEAVTAALDGDTIIIRDGVYSGFGNIGVQLNGKEIELRSENGPASCIVDCAGLNRGFSLEAQETRNTVVEGITIRNGYDSLWGGGVKCVDSGPTFRGCVFDGCWGTVGGAVYTRNSASHSDLVPHFDACTFTGNSSCRGGAIFCRSGDGTLITDCVFEDNEAEYGGALSGYRCANVQVSRCEFLGNAAFTSACGGVEGNHARGGAARFFGAMSASFTSCLFDGNTAELRGGAVSLDKDSSGGGTCSFTNCAFVSNEAGSVGVTEGDGGAIHAEEASVTVVSCTISNNAATGSGGGLAIRNCHEAEIAGSILWGNSDSAGSTESSQVYIDGGEPLRVSFSCIQGLTSLAGNGNIGDDPLLTRDHYHLRLGSRCVNHGDPAYSGFDSDIDGEPRILLGRVDIGADEYFYFVGDCNDNGQPDADDIAKGVSQDCNDNGVPDECEIAYSIADDCNNNSIPDDCDIDSGVSEDCNGDLVPDECQDTSADCDGNGIWDACDIADGTYCDRNENSVPDICETPRTIHVDDDAPLDPGPRDPLLSDPYEDGSADHPFDAIQEAIDVAIDGDLVLLADGLYAGIGNRNLTYGGRDIAVRSRCGPLTTVIDCEQAGRGFAFDAADPIGVSLAGVTITNGVAVGGGAIDCTQSDPWILNCLLVGNKTADGTTGEGGAIRLARVTKGRISNCLMAGNSAGRGGGLCSVVNQDSGCNTKVFGCTIASNVAAEGGGVFAGKFGGTTRNTFFNNSIIWDNAAAVGREMSVASSISGTHRVHLCYTSMANDPGAYALDGGAELLFEEGYISVAPAFVGGGTGTWNTAAAYDGTNHQTIFSDATASWQNNELAGKLLQPDTAEWPCCLIAGNTTTTISVWGDFSLYGTTGATYQVRDFRLAAGSPCIDSGRSDKVTLDMADVDGDILTDEYAPLDLAGIRRFTNDPSTLDMGLPNPPVHPEVVDMGAFEFGLLADLNGDCAVNLVDQAILLANYGRTGCPLTYEDGDLTGDGIIGLDDLATLLGVYGTSCD